MSRMMRIRCLTGGGGAAQNGKESTALRRSGDGGSKQTLTKSPVIGSVCGRGGDDNGSRRSTAHRRHCILLALLTFAMCFSLAYTSGPTRADLLIAHMMIFFTARINDVLDFRNQPVVFERSQESIDSLQTIEWFDPGLTNNGLFDMIWHKRKRIEERDIRLIIAKRECIVGAGILITNGSETQLTRARFKRGFVRPQDSFVSVHDQKRMELLEIQDAQVEMLEDVSGTVDRDFGAEYMETWENCDQDAYEILKPWSSGVLETRRFATEAQKPLAASSVGQIRERKMVELTSQFPDRNFTDTVCHAATTWKLERIYLSEDRVTADQAESGKQELFMHGIGNQRFTDLAVEANHPSLTGIVTNLEFSGKEGFVEEEAQCGRDTITNIISYGIVIAVAAYGAHTALIKQILQNDWSWRSVSALRKYAVVQDFLRERLESTRKLKMKMLAYSTVATLVVSLPLFLAIRGELCFLSINVQEGRLKSMLSNGLEHIKRVVPAANELAGGENCRPINEDPKDVPEGQGQCEEEPCIRHEERQAIAHFYFIMSTRSRKSNIAAIAAVVASAAIITAWICYKQVRVGPVNTGILDWPPLCGGGTIKTRRFVLLVALSKYGEDGRILGSLQV